MKTQKNLFIFIFLFTLTLSFKASAQNNIGAFDTGEWFKFRLRYGFINAGFATLEVQDTIYNNKSNYFIKGKGWTTGVTRLFFKVEDIYQSVVDKESLYPVFFKRRISEGGYKKKKNIIFNQEKLQARVINFKHNTDITYSIKNKVQDMMSSMYFLRNTDLSNLKINEEVSIDLFYDQELNNFKLRFLGKEIIRTKFGKIKTLKFKPFVESGRVFKDKNSVTVWISDDENKIILKIKAELAVGSLKAELVSFKGLANPFPIIFKKIIIR